MTRVAPAHLGGFGSLKAVQRAKQELVQTLQSDGTAFLNVDDPLVAAMARECRGRVVTFGVSPDADIQATDVRSFDDVLQLVVNNFEYRVPVCGRHNVTNVLAAIAVGLEVGLPAEQIGAGLQKFQPAAGRCNVSNVGRWKVIDDTYNASPASVTAAIRLVEDFHDCHHRILALSDMLDLGTQSPELHYGIGAALAQSRIDHVAVTGQFSEHVVEGFLACGGGVNRISRFDDQHTMVAMLDCLLSDDDLILVKGSRDTHMERVVTELQLLAARPESSFLRAA